MDLFKAIWERTFAGWNAALETTIGEAGASVVWTAVAVVVVAFTLVRGHYVRLLTDANNEKASPRTQADYVALRESLAAGGNFSKAYQIGLTRLLNRVDRFFGDAGQGDRSWPSPFGNVTPAPFWTANAYDRCLLLAFIYPLAVIVVMWTITGDVGPAAASLGYTVSDNAALRWIRIGAGAAFGALAVIVIAWVFRRLGRPVLFGVAVVAITLIAVRLPGYSNVAAFVASVVAAFMAGPPAGALLSSAAIAASFGGNPRALGADQFFVLSLVLPTLVTGMILTAPTLIARWRGFALLLFTASALIAMPLTANRVELLFGDRPSMVWPLVVFVGVIPLTKAAFDWLSLGVTRALARRGVERGGWWPTLYALVDVAISFVVFLALAGTMIVGIQTFNLAVEMAGGETPFPLNAIVAELAIQPQSPTLWWVYATLFSTLVPSLVNLTLGGVALARTVPLMPKVALSQLPEDRDVPSHRRWWAASILSFQWVFGGVFAIVFLAGLWVLGALAFPQVGVWLIDGVVLLAEFNLPARIAGGD